MPDRLRQWLIFAALAVIWGTSLFWQKLALRELGPFQIVAYRFLLAFILLFGLMRARGHVLPGERRTWLEFLGFSLVYSVAPVLLAALAGARIDSGLGSVLGATTPLFTIVLSAVAFREEAVTAARTAGTLIGFAGMVVIVGADVVGLSRSNDVLGQFIQIGSAFGNALASLVARRMLNRHHALVQAVMLVLWADAVMWGLTPLVEPVRIPIAATTWAGLLWLGLLSSGMANVLYFDLLKAWGATRSGMVSYAIPVVGLAAGALLGETISPQLAAGGALVLVGIALVNGVIALPRRARAEAQA